MALGTASQSPTRHRNHNSHALRWDDQLVLFDPGEGTQRQCMLAATPVARATAVCITHFHGDHALGLPGLIQRRALDNRSTLASTPQGPDGPRDGGPAGPTRPTGVGAAGAGPGPLSRPLPVVYPAAGQEYFDRLRHATVFHDTSEVVPTPVTGDGPVLRLGSALTLSARALEHRIPTFGYRLDEDEAVRFDPAALAHHGIGGPDVGRLRDRGHLDTPAGTVTLAQVSRLRRGQSMAFVMDTRWCDGALALADGVDLLVCESTFLHEHHELAHRYGHLTALEAGRLAAEAGVRRLVLTHFSARYPDTGAFAREAGLVFDDVVALDDLGTIDVPPRTD